MRHDHATTAARPAFARFVEGWCPMPDHAALTTEGHCLVCAVTWSMPKPTILVLDPYTSGRLRAVTR